MNEMLKSWISTKRVGEFLTLEELDEPSQVEDKEYAIQINGDFTWDREIPTPTMEGSIKNFFCLVFIFRPQVENSTWTVVHCGRTCWVWKNFFNFCYSW
jgi:hypothetical protein